MPYKMEQLAPGTTVVVKAMRAHNGQKPIALTESGRLVYGFNDDGQPICNSPLPRRRHRPDATGMFCQKIDTEPNGRCKLHGGKALAGINHPGFKQGKFSSIGGVLAKTYKRVYEDPKLMELKSEIAAGVAIQEQLIERITAGLSPKFVDTLFTLVDEACAAAGINRADAGDVGAWNPAITPTKAQFFKICDVIQELDTLLYGERDAQGAIANYVKVGEHARKLNETEQKRVERLGALVKITDVLSLLVTIETLANETITIAEDRRRFGAALHRLVSEGHGGPTTAVSTALGGFPT